MTMAGAAPFRPAIATTCRDGCGLKPTQIDAKAMASPDRPDSGHDADGEHSKYYDKH